MQSLNKIHAWAQMKVPLLYLLINNKQVLQTIGGELSAFKLYCYCSASQD